MPDMARARGTLWYLAWSQVGLVLVLMLGGLAFSLAGNAFRAGMLPYMCIGLTTSVVGAMIAANRPENAIGWLFIGIASSVGIASFAAGYVDYARADGIAGFSRDSAEWVAGAIEPVAFHSIVPLLLLFPTGRLLTGPWRVIGVVLLAAVVVALVTAMVIPWPLENYQKGPALPPDIYNPLAIEGRVGAFLNLVQGIAFLTMGFGLVVAVLSLAYRYRAADSLQRQQIKWTAWAGVLVGLAVLGGNVLDIMYVSRWNDRDSLPILLTLLSISVVPVTAGIAILRYRLYDIDRIINRTLVYALLTAALGLTYLALVLGLQGLSRPLSEGSDLSIAVTTLVIAALFLPVRRRIQEIVNRRFNRRAYDAARTMDEFGARLRQQVDLDTLRYELLAVVDETMQPVQASVWLRGNER